MSGMMDGRCLLRHVSILWPSAQLTGKSGARAAQFEHQILITEDGFEILTQSPRR